ncbi:MAG: right-handed parallel beta-helix repeat-containing protein [Sedimentisphaerales bacterium]|nr:right-handed parallel beta-helix repeat-containing protein [Sedimentisphaerales bacterium]
MLTRKRIGMVWVIATVACAASQGLAATLHVDPNDPAAFQSIQEAIDNARDFDTVVVHPAVYQEHIDFFGKAITVTSRDPNDPDVIASTVIDGNDVGVAIAFRNAEARFSVVRGLTIRRAVTGISCSGLDTEPRVEECTLHLNRVGIACDGGAGIVVLRSLIAENAEYGMSDCRGELKHSHITGNGLAGLRDPRGTVIACVIEKNNGPGVGIWSHGVSSNFTDCTISANASTGVYHQQWVSSLLFTRCVISNNATGGVYDDGQGSMKLVNCIVRDNKGRGVCLVNWSSAEMENCIVSANHGTAVISWNGSHAQTRNCTIVGNKGHGVQTEGISNATVVNSIIAQNTGYGIYYEDARGRVTLNHNAVFANGSGPYGNINPGEHDLDARPFFAAAGYWDTDGKWVEGDYHLMSTVGRWDPVAEAWVTDPIDSPCLDKGDPNSPVGDEPYPNGGRINMGAYGGTAEASKSMPQPPIPMCVEYPEMDFNRDCKVDQADLDLFLEHWLECGLDDPNACWPDGPPAAPEVKL